MTSASFTIVPTRPERRIRISSLLAALPDFGLAGLFLMTWIAPGIVGTDRVGTLMLVMLLEFIVVHSAGFMGMAALAKGSRRARTLVILKFGAFYTLFVVGWSLAFRTWWPLLAFWGLTVNRMLGVIVGQAPSGEERRFIKAGWAVGAISYLGAVFFTSLFPIPRLGITREVIAVADLPGSGLWIDQPYRVLAAGLIYFGAVAISELYDHRWIPASSLPGEASGAARGRARPDGP